MPTCPANSIQYTVKSGDTLWTIAKRYDTTILAILALNPGININNLSVGQVICVPHRVGISPAQLALNNQIRTFWEQHVFWTRLTIINMVFNLPGTDLITKRLLENPKDFAVVFRHYYGENAASGFENLFTSHLVIAAQLVAAAIANDAAAAADAEKRWYANADEIAAFLASINTYWSEQTWRNLLYSHLAMTKKEAVDLISHNIADSITTFDNIEKEALVMADTMTQGIVRQFPNNF